MNAALNNYLSTLSPMQSGKASKHLSQKILYTENGKIYTRADLVVHLIDEGLHPVEYQGIDYDAREKAQDRLNDIKKKYTLGLSNENLPIIKEARLIEKSLENNDYLKTDYCLKDSQGIYFPITKTMFQVAIHYAPEKKTTEKEEL
jgi:hypothetical protein